MAATLVFEGLIDLSPKIALTLRGSAGVSLLFPSGDLDDDAQDLADLCSNAVDCQANPGPYFGAQAAVGAGLLYNLGSVGARVDFQLRPTAIACWAWSSGATKRQSASQA
ncbi:MAG: hypothetical protein IPM35_41590 [Myxococcales bacterium]|nr:hypothetical protein [Myxococcales bacterium]